MNYRAVKDLAFFGIIKLEIKMNDPKDCGCDSPRGLLKKHPIEG